MAKVSTKEEFIRELKKFTKTNNKDNILFDFPNNIITIDETDKSGQGEIYLDISGYSDDTFFIKIDNQSGHNIGSTNKHNDGIVLKVNLEHKSISVFLFELKIQLRFNKLETASMQLHSAYRFIKYLQLEECFDVDYEFFIAYETNNIAFDIDILKTCNPFSFALFNALYENKNLIPLQIPFCAYKKYAFRQLVFGETIDI